MIPHKYYLCSSFVFLAIYFLNFLPTIEASQVENEVHIDSKDLTTPNPICQELATLFGSAVSDFSFCSVRNARPINLCQGCVNKYLTVWKAYNDISAAYVGEIGEMISCKEYFTNLDRLEILGLNLDFVKNLWDRGHCDYCFVWDANGTITEAVQGDITRFHQWYIHTEGCLSRNAQTNTTCTNCRIEYTEMNELYSQLEEEYGENLCFDIVDTMNRTRQVWSYNNNCFPIRKSEFWVYGLMAFMGICPISFYVLAFALSNVQEATVVRLRRMGDTTDLPNTFDETVAPLNTQSEEPCAELSE